MAVNSPAINKWRAVLGMHFQDSFAYRAQGIIWILTDTVPTITLPLMWLAAFSANPDMNSIAGFTRTTLVAYYLCLSVVNNLVFAHPWEIARDIKDGRLSVFLLRPFSYYSFIFASNLSWRVVRTFLYIPFFCIILFIFRKYLVWGDYDVGWRLWLAIIASHILSYQLAWLLGLVAFFLVEISGVYEFYYMFSAFLAGQMAPLQMLPEAVQRIAHVLPFSYVLWFPVQIFLGKMPHDAIMQGIAVQMIWSLVLFLAGKALWNIGIKRYTAVGI